MIRRTCQGKTQRGTKCRAVVIGDNRFCTVHGGEWEPLQPVYYYCAGFNARNQPCHAKVREPGGFCRSHGGVAEQNAEA